MISRRLLLAAAPLAVHPARSGTLDNATMAAGLHPDFPIVSGSYQMTEQWSVVLPDRFNRRIEDGSLVLWRPELTFWIIVWGLDIGRTLEEQLQGVLSRASRERTTERIERSAQVIRLTYEVPEHDPKRLKPKYTSISGYVFGALGRVQISAYSDSESARKLAYKVIGSVQGAA